MIRAILFDLDDTLVEFHHASPRALFDAGAARVYAFLTAKGCSLPAFEQFLSQQRGIDRWIRWKTRLSGGEPDGRRMFRRICKDYGLQRDASALAKLGWLWYDPVRESADLAPDVIPTLKALRAGDVKLALVVNTLHQGEVIDRHLEALGLLEFFPVRAYSTEVGARKPDPHLFNAALEELKVAPSAALFVGDDPKADILGARRLGMQTVLRQPANQPRPKGLADYAIENISQLLELFDIVPSDKEPRKAVKTVARALAP